MYALYVRELLISLSVKVVFITNLKKMEEIRQLHNELNELSENEEKNKERMLEIAKILVDFYIPNRNKNDKKLNSNQMCHLLKTDRIQDG
jgi:hypothetical protein